MSAVDYAVEGDVAVLTVNYPPVNALSLATRKGLWAGLDQAEADDAVKAIVILGGGSTFIAGADITEFGTENGTTPPGLHLIQERLEACPKLTIAAIHGWCIGGGVDLISAVDIRYASADAKFSVREVKLSIVADVGSLARLPYILNDGHLRELALTGKDIDAGRAEKIGLVNDVLPDAEATLAAAHATAAEIASNSPLVTRGIKDVLDEQRTADVAASLRYVAAWNSAFLPSRDLKEGISAMFAKREPNFTGE